MSMGEYNSILSIGTKDSVALTHRCVLMPTATIVSSDDTEQK